MYSDQENLNNAGYYLPIHYEKPDISSRHRVLA